MSYQKIIGYWKESAIQSWKTANALYKSKRYSDCLFYCHITLEKLLKGLVVSKTKTHSPYIHDLNMLAQKAGLGLTQEEKKELATISKFNIRARYDDDKFSFYRLADKKYAAEYFKVTSKYYLWLSKKYQKK